MPDQDIIQILKSIAHPTRLAILELLRDEEQCVCHIEAALKLRQAYISQHLMILRQAGLVEDRRDGSRIYYRVILPEVYSLVDAANALELENPRRYPAKVKNCPCPKCSQAG